MMLRKEGIMKKLKKMVVKEVKEEEIELVEVQEEDEAPEVAETMTVIVIPTPKMRLTKRVSVSDHLVISELRS
jgi:hypothetical protein